MMICDKCGQGCNGFFIENEKGIFCIDCSKEIDKSGKVCYHFRSSMKELEGKV